MHGLKTKEAAREATACNDFSDWTDCLITNAMFFPVTFLFILVLNMNNEQKELLAAEVQKIPYLYEKSCANYKNRVQVDLAWV